MKKEMFSTEISILRDTFRRLLRRHAKTNIIKLIDKTHPADMALIFRYFNDSEQDTVFAMMKPSEKTVEFLNELDEAITIRIVENETPSRIAEILEEMQSSNKAAAVSSKPTEGTLKSTLAAGSAKQLIAQIRAKKAGVDSDKEESSVSS